MSESDKESNNVIWGGRFSSGPSAIMQEINPSIDFDWKLFAHDIAVSRAHAFMLGERGIIDAADASSIAIGLDRILSEMNAGTFSFSRALEDIHMNVEARLTELIGPAAGRLHTARSRNDQVATDFKLYVRDMIDRLNTQCRRLQWALAVKALDCADMVMPGFTHLQSAQPVTFGHHLLAYVEMLHRDRGRFSDARRRGNECPLGAAALAGTSFPIDRYMTAELLGFDRPTANSLDSVSDRDFALEVLAAGTITVLHLSRFAEEIILWVTPQFGFLKLSDAFTTGSSIMPQKRNPDAAELIRAKTGRILGAFTGLSLVLKALPLSYSKDMQEDKEPVFDALETLSLALCAMTALVKDMQPDPVAMRRAAMSGFSTATDLADWLVSRLSMPFRDAHHIAGRLVALAESGGVGLQDLSLAQMQSIEPCINEDIFSVLSVEQSVSSRISYGGTAPENVRKMAENWCEFLKEERGSDPSEGPY
ncbi:MAG: argininosuccinate lyase [Alphaproteobacteria bacterium]|nr:argininosuccinate lyase [Alphaproteobacteria bacterium]